MHKAPWEATPRHPLAEDVWELYNVDEDFSETNDLAASNPAKLKELQALFMKEAEKYRVLPIDDRSIERFDAAIAGRPDLMAGRKSLTVYEGMTGMTENAFINVKNQSFTITADVEIPAGGANGVILCPGRPLRRLEPVREGRQAGLHLQLRRASSSSRSTAAERAGRRARPPSRWTSPTTATDAARAARPRSPSTARRSARGASSSTNANIFSADDAADVGVDEGTNVSSAYKQHGNEFTGNIEKVTIDVK